MKKDNSLVTQLPLFGEEPQPLPEKKPRAFGECVRDASRKGSAAILLYEGEQRGYPAISIEASPGHPFSISAGEFAYRYALQMGATLEEIDAAIWWLTHREEA
jgi:hypothetical protein